MAKKKKKSKKKKTKKSTKKQRPQPGFVPADPLKSPAERSAAARKKGAAAMAAGQPNNGGKTEKGQQALFDHLPPGTKKIVEAANLYKKYQAERIAWGKKESEQKQLVTQMIHDAGFQRLEDGAIRFTCEHKTISLIPQDDKLKIEDAEE